VDGPPASQTTITDFAGAGRRVLGQEEVGHRGAEDFRLARHRESEEAAQRAAEGVAPGHAVAPVAFAVLAVVRHILHPSNV
jgi:hypothetical protein